MLNKLTVRDVDVAGKRVLVRADFNVPIVHGRVTDDSRIRAALPTIEYLMQRGAKVILMSHLGRPSGVEDRFRLDPVARSLSDLLDREVTKIDKTVTDDVCQKIDRMKPGEIILIENLRFNPGEKENDPEFAGQLAALADVYVNDAFGAAHRAHASVVGVASHLPAVGGLLLEKEVNTLSGLLERPDRPFVAILGGSKVSDKLGVVDRFVEVVDALLIGGGMCFTFLKAKGIEVGASIVEDQLIGHCHETITKAEGQDVALYLPSDIVIAERMAADARAEVVPVELMRDGWMGLDIGPKTSEIYANVIAEARTIFWNGPMGVFELEPFADGTREIAEAVANSKATTIVGGGDTDAALRQFGLEDRVSFVSTGGGASLKMLEGARLPGVDALMDKVEAEAEAK